MEKVILRFHPTRLRHVKRYFLGTIFILAGLALYFNMLAAFGITFELPDIYFLFLMLVGVLLFASAELSRIFYTYIVTDQRLLRDMGFFQEQRIHKKIKIKDFDKWYEKELEERWRRIKHAVSRR